MAFIFNIATPMIIDEVWIIAIAQLLKSNILQATYYLQTRPYAAAG